MLDQIIQIGNGIISSRPDPSKVAQILGFANSVITFVLTNVLQRRALVRWRGETWWTFAILWSSFVLCLVDVIIWQQDGKTALGIVENRLLTKVSLIFWIIGICMMLYVIRKILSIDPSSESPIRILRSGQLDPFCMKRLSRFGVPFVDDLIFAGDISDKFLFPLAIISQRNASGFRVAQKFFVEGLRNDAFGGGVYLSFTRPSSIIEDQLSKLFVDEQEEIWKKRTVIIDCYSPLYPSASSGGSSHNNLKVVPCDPRDPSEIQVKLEEALVHLQEQQVRNNTCTVRVVYDSLSDFLAVADQELVVAYLRRSIVWEELNSIQSVYLVWHDIIKAPVSDDYLAWYGNTVLWLKKENDQCNATLDGVSLKSVACSYGTALELGNMDGFSFDPERAKTVASLLKKLSYSPANYDGITPFADDHMREIHFLFFLTAIDHNTHGKKRYEQQIDGRAVHGSDLLYVKAKEAVRFDKDFFMPDHIESIQCDNLREVFKTSGGIVPEGLEERAVLLRNAARVLLEEYHGDLTELFKKSKNLLMPSVPREKGILERLKAFKAYQDPLGKKSFLLIKLLRRRNLVTVEDTDNIRVPIDHVLMTVCLRSGMVLADEKLKKIILDGVALDEKSMDSLRRMTAVAFRHIAEESLLAPDIFDDIFWAYGRECFKFSPPFTPSQISEINIPLSANIGNPDALSEFLLLINGLDAEAPKDAKCYPMPIPPKTHFF